MSDVNAASSPWIEACPSCGAEPWSPDKPCWLCQLLTEAPPATPSPAPRPDAATAPGLRPAAPSSPPRDTPRPGRQAPPPPDKFSFSLTTLLLVITQAAVLMGLLVLAPGLAIVASILLMPALVRTAMVVRRRTDSGYTVSPGQKIALTMSSMFVTLVVLVVAVVASVGTFCAVCIGLAEASNANDSNITGLMVFSGLVALVATGVAARFLAKWVRNRYRRDVERG